MANNPVAAEYLKNVPFKYMKYIQEVVNYLHQADPYFNQFYIDGQVDFIEVGDRIPQIVDFIWETVNPDSVKPDSIKIEDVTKSVLLKDGLADDGIENIIMPSPVIKTNEDGHTFKITCEHVNGSAISAEVTYNWQWRIYWGSSLDNALTDPTLLLNSILGDTLLRSFHFPDEAQKYRYICYPAFWEPVDIWTDDHGGLNVPFVNLGNYPVSNTFGVSTLYTILRSSWKMGGVLDITPIRGPCVPPDVDPEFTQFEISGQAVTLEVGDQIPAAVTFDWNTSNSGNVKPNSVNIRDVTSALDLALNLANDGTEDVVMPGPIQKLIKDSHTFKIDALNINLAPFERNKVYYWVFRAYWGTNASDNLTTEAEIKALISNQLRSSYQGNYAMPEAASEYKYICFPTSYGAPDTGDFFKVETGWPSPFINVGTVSVENALGVTTNYYVYRSENKVGGAMTIRIV